MLRIAFADESGTAEKSDCYAIGVITLPEEYLDDFNDKFSRLRDSHGLVGEAKWKKIGKSHGSINFLLDWVDTARRSDEVTFDAIVVHKDLYRNWRGRVQEKETAFYQTYTQLLKHVARRARDTIEVYIDGRSDTYPKRDEVVEVITNRMLAKVASKGKLRTVTPSDSRLTPGIQVADILTGVMNTGHRKHLEAELRINAGKQLAIERTARILGWDSPLL